MSWPNDLSANQLDATYITGFLDISGGNLTIRNPSYNLIMANGNATFGGMTTFTNPYTYTTDISLNNRLFVVGDVSMTDVSLNVQGNVTIKGKLSAGSYKNSSIALTAINTGSVQGGTTATYYTNNSSNSTISKDISYNGNVQMNGIVALNTPVDYPYLFTSSSMLSILDAQTSVAQKWQDIEISSTGQYQIAVVGGNRVNNITGSYTVTDVSGNVWTSSNYGKTWTEQVVGGGVKQWMSAMISGDGSIMMVKAKGNVLYRSTNYGVTWANINFTYADLPVDLNWGNKPGVIMRMSYDGMYVFTYYYKTATSYGMLVSANGGSSWIEPAGCSGYITSFNASKSGQYVIVTYGVDNLKKPMYSANYGVTFVTLTNGPVSNAVVTQYASAVSTISNTGKICMLINTTLIYTADVTTGTVASGANNAAFTTFTMANSGPMWSINSSNDGKYIIMHARENVGPAKAGLSYASYDYGSTFFRLTGSVIMLLDTTNNVMKRVWATRFSADNKYIAAVQEFGFVYVKKTNTVPNPYIPRFATATTLKIGNQIQFSDGSTISNYNANKETDGTTFKPSTFKNMTVIGTFTSPSPVVTSDYRIKTNIQTLDETHVLDKLRPVTYYQTQLQRQDIGFLAHELQEHYPELVTGEKDGDQMQSVNYTGVLAILINEVQRLKRSIDDAEAAIAAKRASV